VRIGVKFASAPAAVEAALLLRVVPAATPPIRLVVDGADRAVAGRWCSGCCCAAVGDALFRPPRLCSPALTALPLYAGAFTFSGGLGPRAAVPGDAALPFSLSVVALPTAALRDLFGVVAPRAKMLVEGATRPLLLKPPWLVTSRRKKKPRCANRHSSPSLRDEESRTASAARREVEIPILDWAVFLFSETTLLR
jgi:hypothetical protein